METNATRFHEPIKQYLSKQPMHKWSRFAQLLLFATLLALFGHWGLQTLAAQALATVAATAPTVCDSVTAVNANECKALVALYSATNGTGWTDQTNWLVETPNSPCDWYGVSCAAGHVTKLNLAANQLSGTLPITVGYLSELTTLRLENNALGGRVFQRVCNLTAKLTNLNLDYNRFYPQSKAAAACLNAVAPNWLDTQTIAPRNLRVSAFYTNALTLSWSPILYTADGGYYEIAYATTLDGPYLVHGTTPNKAADQYLVDGLLPGQRYFFKVHSYTPAHGAQQNALDSRQVPAAGMTKATSGKVLVAAYFPADNDLSTQISYVLTRMRRGTQFNPNVTVVLLVDGLGDNNTRLVVIQDGVVTPTTVIEDVWQKQELDTADPATLSWFLTYARDTYPASKIVVSLLGHGLALAPELSFADPLQAATATRQAKTGSGKFPPLPRDWDDMPNDVTNNSYMSTTDVGEALLAATDNGARPFDVIFFDQCFQGNLDALYEVYRAAEMFVASPNYAWLVAAYDKYFLGFSPNMSAQELATNIITPYENTLNQHHPNAIFAIPGSAIPLIADAVSQLGDTLANAVNDGQQGRIVNAVRGSSYVDTTQCGKRNLQLGPPDELIGIEGFGRALLTEFASGDSYGVSAAIEQLRIAMQPVAKESRSGAPYIAPDEFWNYRDSLTILAPLPRDSRSDVAWRASIYSANAPFTATWTLDPTEPVTVTKSLAYTKAGRWDDFLSVWFQGLTPTVGQWCHYMPPELVLVDNVEPLTLTLTLAENSDVTLNWNPADDLDAEEYLIYQIDPYAVSWELTESLGVTSTTATLPALAAGSYQIQILARTEDNLFVAQSNVATAEIPEVLSPTGVKIYLPSVLRQ